MVFNASTREFLKSGTDECFWFMFGCCPKTRAGVLADHLLLAVILNTVVDV